MVLSLWVLALTAGAAEPALSFADAKVAKLPNGMTVVVREDKRTDTVALFMAVPVGARDEAEGEHGCAHLFEHLMFEGSANVPTNKFDAWLTGAGGENNAWTSADTTAYHMTFPSGALDMALFLESDRVGFLDAGLTEENVANQQLVVLQERARGYASPHGRDWDALNKVSFDPSSPYHHPVIGTVADIEGFAIDKVRNFWDTHYRSQGLVLGVVGAIDADVAIERISHWFSDVPDRGPAPKRATAEELAKLPFPAMNAVLEDEIEDRSVHITYRGVPLRHADEPALDLLSMVLDNGRGTRLAEALYYKSQLSHESFAYAYMLDADGLFMFSASSERTPLKKLVRAMDKVIAGLVRNPPTQAELDRARDALYNERLDRLENVEDVANTLVECLRAYGDHDCMERDFDRYRAVVPADLLRVAQAYLIDKPRSTLSVVPRGDRGALKGAVPVELP